MAVHVIGNACLDTTFRVERLPLPGETVNAEGSDDDLGGKGLNQAIVARRAGAVVHFWAAIGNDAGGDRIANRLAAEGIGAEHLPRLPRPTDRSTLIVDQSGENMIVSDVGCARLFDPFAEAHAADSLAPGDIVVLQGNLGRDATVRTVASARSRGCKIVYNASPLGAAETTPPGVVDVLVVNRQEARALAGLKSAAEATLALTAKGAATVVITLGADGVMFRDREGLRSLPGHRVAAIDTSGAGDVFAGVLAAGLDRGFGLAEAVSRANRAAAIATTRRGALAACPTREELAGLMRAPEETR